MALFFKTERALRDGYRAWHRGDLDAALERFEAALEKSHRAPDVLYPLARLFSERNEHEKALSLLEDARASDPDSLVGRLFLAIVRYDHGEAEKAREELARLAGENILAKALLELLDFKEENRRSVSLPRAARWLAEVAGRLLSILEGRLHGSDLQGAARFHHVLFSPGTLGTKSSEIEAAFLSEKFDEVASLGRGAAEDLQQSDRVYCAFSLIALGQDKAAERLLEEMEAAWSFVRAARLADIEVDHVLTELAEKLGVAIELE